MFKQLFTANRANSPYWPSVLQTLRGQDTSAGLDFVLGDQKSIIVDKSTDWTPTQITQVQNVIDTAPDATPEIDAQFQVDGMNIFMKAFLLTLLDQINVLRTKAGLATITPAQAIQAVRDKAATL